LARVDDNGEGMDAADARLALERHATSKIARADDLAAIVTFGFRGEALPAIASVSHLTLRTRLRGALAGTEIRVHAGTVASIMETGAPEGTSVEVADLFHNLPARRKFLKADAAESAQVSRVVTQMALANPAVGFTLTSAGRLVLDCPPVRTLAERFYQLYGERPDLVEIRKEASGIRVRGYIAALAEQGPTRGPQHLYVNGRIVKDRTIAHAVIDAYSVASVKERSPEIHLFLEMAPDMVDVNVHPTKAEVRFRNQSAVHEVVRRAIGAALGAGPAPELQLQPPPAGAPAGTSPSFPGILASGSYPSRWSPVGPGPGGMGGRGEGGAPASGFPAGSGAAGARAPRPDATGPDRIRPMIPLGQFRDTFIIAVDDEGIAIVDQHVAHERVLFELAMQRLADGRLESQRLLEPMLIELPASGREALAERAAELERLGFEVEGFGGDAVRVTALPALLSPAEAAAAVRAVADDLEHLDRGARVDEALRRIAATTACHAAVKANAPLTFEKMAHILEELRQTAYSTVCPHGRPVMLRITRREVERNFQRI
ncbi:MAG: DNA mismatch repair protein MutL, partial [Acidobacteria bacterium]|nr:DNA mismatch repair protein MutL [Acidobacteriota bacterium]